MNRLGAEAFGVITPMRLSKRAPGFGFSAMAPADRFSPRRPAKVTGHLRAQSCSAARSSRFRSTPQRYPVSDPSAPTTR